LGTVKGGATIRSPLIFAISSAKSLIALARSSSVDVLSITMAEAPVIAKSSVSSAIFSPMLPFVVCRKSIPVKNVQKASNVSLVRFGLSFSFSW